jgi:hypothetical protein
MKTSNKILLGLLSTILVFIVVTLITIRCNFNYHPNSSKIELVGNTEAKLTLSKFNKIDVENNFVIHYTQDTFQSIRLVADSSIINLAEIKVIDGKLLIQCKDHIWTNSPKFDVYITNDSIIKAELSAGAEFRTEKELKVYDFTCSGSAGAELQLNGTFTNLKLDFSAGSKAVASGTCKNITLESSAGSEIIADNMVAQIGKIEASAGANIKAYITEELDVEASSGALVNCKGNPKLKNFDVSSGAQFTK